MRRPTTTPRLARALTVAALALCALPAAAVAADPVSRTDARRTAVRVSAQTCAAVPWCQGSGVVPARRCRRGPGNATSCAMWFRTAGGARCHGLVSVERGARGRLAVGMAVPMPCGPDRAVA